MTPLHYGQYVHLDVLPNGDLRVTLTPGTSPSRVRTKLGRRVNDDENLAFLLNPGGVQYDFLFVADISYVDGGHLSNAPAIIDQWKVNDRQGQLNTPDYVEYLTLPDSRVWYWNDYAIISILEHIKRQGEAVLTLLR